MIDVEVIKNILKQLSAEGQKRVSLSDIAMYSHCNYQEAKQSISILSRYFNVSKSGRAVYVSLKG